MLRNIVLPGRPVRVRRTADGKEREGCWCCLDRSLLLKPMEGPGINLSQCELHEITNSFPSRFQDCSWECFFDTSVHGYSLSQFYRSTSELSDPVVGIFFASRRQGGAPFLSCFGCLCPVAPTLAHGPHHFFGSRETMIFDVQRGRDEAVHSYKWSRGGNEEFMICSHHFLGIGGGKDGAAIYLDAEFQYGSSSVHCPTFDSPSLIGEGDGLLRHVEFSVERVLWFRLIPLPIGASLTGRLAKCECRRQDSEHNCLQRSK